MSCTVVAVPIALSQIIIPLIAGGIVGAIEMGQTIAENKNAENEQVSHLVLPEAYECESDDVKTQSFIERTFETNFMDKDLLKKTLEEHGATDINDISGYNGEIIAKVDSYTLTFRKTAEDKPYSLNITCLESDSAEEKMNDLSSEYTLNVQEESYLNIVENLKKNNMSIEQEEVQEDNTIVLTVNLE